MKKIVGTKNFAVSIKIENDKDIEKRINTVIWDYVSKTRGELDSEECIKVIPYLIFCTYVAKNHDYLEIEDYDLNYAYDDIRFELGNTYSVREFLRYFENLHSPICSLPALEASNFIDKVNLNLLQTWFSVFDDSCLALREKDGYSVANAIWRVLASERLFDPMGREVSMFAMSPSLAKMMVAIADVSEKRVFDFACGCGMLLSTSLMEGATQVAGFDLNAAAVEQAKIRCFFSNPVAHAAIVAGDMRVPVKGTAELFDRIVITPPFGEPLHSNWQGSLNGDLSIELSEKTDWHGVPIPNSMEAFSIVRALSQLGKEGIAVVQITPSMLFRSNKNDVAFREALIEGGYLQAVVELPAGAALGTAIKTALLIFGRTKKYEDVLLVDMDSSALKDKRFYERMRPVGNGTFSDEGIRWLAELLSEHREIDLVSKLVSKEELSRNDCILQYSRYGEVVDFRTIWETARSVESILADRVKFETQLEEVNLEVNHALKEIFDESNERRSKDYPVAKVASSKDE